jgi:hypothetical protein
MSSQTSPRFHHYLFAHRFLPHYAFLPGVDIFHVLEEQKENILKQLWAIAAEHVDLNECLPFSGFKIYFVKSPPFMGAVIVLPEPKNITEAHMVLFVRRRDRKLAGKKPSRCRYFTLEYGKNNKDTVLGEWTSRRHTNYGTGPNPTVRDFWEAIIGIINPDIIPSVSNVK